MDNRLIASNYQAEYTPEESASLMRLRVFILMRWIAIFGVIAAALIASKIFGIGFPTIPVYIICVFMAIYNLILLYQYRSLKKEKTGGVIHRARVYSNIHILLDLVTLTVLIHFTGGIENPFIIYYVFHAIAASTILNYRTTYILATVALALVSLLVGLEYAGWIPHYNLNGFADPTLYQKINYVLPVLITLATVFYGATYMTTAISGELRLRQRQVVSLGSQLLEEKTAELEQASQEMTREIEMQNRLSAANRELSESLKRLKESQEQLIQVEKINALGQLSAAIAHEINNPLAGVIVYTQLLMKKLKGDSFDKEDALNILTKMDSALANSGNLVRSLLDFARQSTPTLKSVDIRNVIEQVMALVGHQAQLKKVKIIRDEAPGLPSVKADFSQLEQVFINLILNGVQAMPDGGELTIRTTPASDGMISVAIRDTGYGIPPENMKKLFTPFFSTKEAVKGVGLGLAISYGIVERHGGRIEVQSEVGKGSTFTVYLPVYPPETVIPPEPMA